MILPTDEEVKALGFGTDVWARELAATRDAAELQRLVEWHKAGEGNVKEAFPDLHRGNAWSEACEAYRKRNSRRKAGF